MGRWLFLLFTVVPVIELALFIKVGGLMGLPATLLLILLTGLLGAALARQEGLKVFTSWQQALAEGRLPEEGVASSLLVLVGGVLLVTPGMLTDVVGFSLLIAPSRKWIAKRLVTAVEKRILAQGGAMHTSGAHVHADGSGFAYAHTTASTGRSSSASTTADPIVEEPMRVPPSRPVQQEVVDVITMPPLSDSAE